MRLGVSAMGTRFELCLAGGDRVSLRAAGEEAIEEIVRWHKMLSCFDAGSDVARVNAQAGGDLVRVGAEVVTLLGRCRNAWRESGGVFDVTVGPLMRAWGLRESPLDLDVARSLTGMGLVEIDPETSRVRLTRAGARLDLGGVGKGAALDAAGDLLIEAGVTSAFLHGGTSSVRAIGAPPGGHAWRVRLSPPPGSSLAPLDVPLLDESLSVSSPHGRRGTTGASHVIDPRSGLPVEGASLAAVIAPRGVDAEIWSTAMLVLGHRPRVPDGWRTFLAGEARWINQGECRDAV